MSVVGRARLFLAGTLPLTVVISSMMITGPSGHAALQTPGRVDGQARKVKPPPPEKGAPAVRLPQLDEIRRGPAQRAEILSPVPSSARSKHKSTPNSQNQDPPKKASAEGDARADRVIGRASHHATALHPAPAVPPPSASDSERAMARINLFNQSGDQIRGRDGEWSLPLVSLPGRAGMDLNLALSWSSLVWTRAGDSIYFDEDKDNVSPGFRLGFPTVSEVFFDNQASVNARLLITSAARRVELRQVGSSAVYESADSSYLQLIDGGNTLTLRGTDGTQVIYANSHYSSGWQATRLEDRNGNYISISNNSQGDIEKITDTLGREVWFFYDSNANLNSIAQHWEGGWHTLASFGWGAPLTLDVSGMTGVNVAGATTGEAIPVLRAVGLPDGSYYAFDYRVLGQVSMIRSYRSDNVQRNYVAYDYDNWSGDCPRIAQTRVWAENWSGLYGVPNEVTTTFAVNGGGSHQTTSFDGTVYREYYGSGWQAGLVTRSEVYGDGVLQKWIITGYEQDNPAVSYQTNPRVIGTDIHDANNLRRTIIDYDSYAPYGLPHVIHEYAADGLTEIRRTYTDYRLSQEYLSQRIIGLVAARQVYDPMSGIWQSKTTYEYDENSVAGQATTATNHDSSYNSGNNWRGNPTSISRWDMTQPSNSNAKLTSHVTYDAAGSLLTVTDAAGHQTAIGYTDSFSDGVARNTFAYPTTATDADNYASTIKYNYDFGAKTETQGPPPAGQSSGLHQIFVYDSVARLYEIYTANTGAATFYNYGPYYLSVWSSVNQVADSYSGEIYDGLGRVFGRMSHHPGSIGGYAAQLFGYDAGGRPIRHTNPAEVTGSWVPTGDDNAGWQYNNSTEYDWKDRPTRTYDMDGSFIEMSYAGCGCAGGEVVTLTDEMSRRQKVYSDVLGRQWKTEVLNDNGSVYSTTTNTLNARDQITNVRVTDNATGVYQDTTMSYDGFGRLWKQHVPEQQAADGTLKYTTYDYNPDDTINWAEDGRGVKATYGYNNNRHLVSSITYPDAGSLAPGVPLTANVSFAYDAARNRTQMNDGSGQTSYSYDSLSRMVSETKTFSGLSGSYTLSYQFNLGGELKKITDPTSATIKNTYDSAGRVTSVTGENTLVENVSTYASNLTYRAWGALKDIDYGNGAHSHLGYNSRLLPTSLALSNVLAPPNYQTATMTWTYDYFADGRTHHARDANDNHFDRAQEYDQAGRIKETYTGREANELSATSPVPDSPYRQTIQYDVWNNLTAKSGRLWRQTMSDSFAYTNNRGPAWRMQYDADGNMIQADAKFHIYDAANQQAQYIDWAHTVGGGQTGHEPAPALEIAQTYDGNNQPAKRVETRRVDELIGAGPQTNIATTVTTTYSLYSTLLGGSTVVEFDANGQKTAGYVYANGQRLAKQTLTQWYSYVSWDHPNAGGNSWVETNSSRGVTRQEMDPIGAEVGTTDPYQYSANPTYGTMKGSEPLFIDGGDPFDYSDGCTSFGMPISCSDASRYLQSGLGQVNGIRTDGVNPRGSRNGGGSIYVDETLIQLSWVRSQAGNDGWSPGQWRLYRDTVSKYQDLPNPGRQAQTPAPQQVSPVPLEYYISCKGKPDTMVTVPKARDALNQYQTNVANNVYDTASALYSFEQNPDITETSGLTMSLNVGTSGINGTISVTDQFTVHSPTDTASLSRANDKAAPFQLVNETKIDNPCGGGQVRLDEFQFESGGSIAARLIQLARENGNIAGREQWIKNYPHRNLPQPLQSVIPWGYPVH